MMNNIIKIGLILFFSGAAFAQNFNATGLSMGNNFLSFSKGVDAFSINPANLAFNNRVEIKFLSPTIAISNSSFSFRDYNRFFTIEETKGVLSRSDTKEFLDLVPDDGLDINTDINLNIFSIVYDNFGFGVDFVQYGGVTIKSKEALKLAFDLDLTPDFSFNEPNFAEGSSLAAAKFSFAYSQLLKTKIRKWDIDNIAVAAKLSYYAGIAVGEVIDGEAVGKRSNKDLTGTDNEVFVHNANLKIRYADPEDGLTGGGFGIDLAASAVYDDDWNFSILLENLFGSITWDEGTEIYQFQNYDSVFIHNDDGVDRFFETDTTRKTGSFKTTLPVNLTIGAHYQMDKKLTLTAQWKQGLSRDFGNVFTPQVGVGAEFRPIPWLPLRSGLTVGGRDAFLFALGTGVDLGVFDFNLAYAMREALWPTYSNGAYFAFDFKLGF
jgi:hypothetical protein